MIHNSVSFVNSFFSYQFGLNTYVIHILMCKKSKHHTFYNGCLCFKNQNMSQFTIDKVLTMHVSYPLKIKHTKYLLHVYYIRWNKRELVWSH